MGRDERKRRGGGREKRCGEVEAYREDRCVGRRGPGRDEGGRDEGEEK